jgi:hypothetical protein
MDGILLQREAKNLTHCAGREARMREVIIF